MIFISKSDKIFEIVFNIDSDNILTAEKLVFFSIFVKYLKESSLVYSRKCTLDISAIVKLI